MKQFKSKNTLKFIVNGSKRQMTECRETNRNKNKTEVEDGENTRIKRKKKKHKINNKCYAVWVANVIHQNLICFFFSCLSFAMNDLFSYM